MMAKSLIDVVLSAFCQFKPLKLTNVTLKTRNIHYSTHSVDSENMCLICVYMCLEA